MRVAQGRRLARVVYVRPSGFVHSPTSDSLQGRYELRGATLSDESALLALAKHLNTVNLPHDRQAVASLLEHAERSFDGTLDEERRKYVFLLWDRGLGRAVGTSTIVSQLGRRDAPYIYFDELDEERYSRSLDKHFHHKLLRLGFSYAGPTELGGLVVDPDCRRRPERLGRFASYGRFAFIYARRSCFRDQLLAELLPPLEPDGTSHLWEALGRRFTGLSYAEADLLSSRDKEFIRDLFPRGIINASLMDARAQAVVGQVGPNTAGVERILRRIGFRYARRVDPFDGGPHFIAQTDEVSLMRASAQLSYAGVLDARSTAPTNILLRELAVPPYVLAVQAPSERRDAGVLVHASAVRALGLREGDSLTVTPLSSAASRPPSA